MARAPPTTARPWTSSSSALAASRWRLTAAGCGRPRACSPRRRSCRAPTGGRRRTCRAPSRRARQSSALTSCRPARTASSAAILGRDGRGGSRAGRGRAGRVDPSSRLRISARDLVGDGDHLPLDGGRTSSRTASRPATAGDVGDRRVVRRRTARIVAGSRSRGRRGGRRRRRPGTRRSTTGGSCRASSRRFVSSRALVWPIVSPDHAVRSVGSSVAPLRPPISVSAWPSSRVSSTAVLVRRFTLTFLPSASVPRGAIRRTSRRRPRRSRAGCRRRGLFGRSGRGRGRRRPRWSCRRRTSRPARPRTLSEAGITGAGVDVQRRRDAAC